MNELRATDKVEVHGGMSCFFRQDAMAHDSATAGRYAAGSGAVLPDWMVGPAAVEREVSVLADAVMLIREELAQTSLDDFA
jgi:hypothetical protein